MLRRIFRFLGKIIMAVAFRVKVIGKENIPAEGKYIVCGNHLHALDAPLMVLSSKRLIRFVGKEEIFKNPIAKFIIKPFGMITIKRGSADMDAMKGMIDALEAGDIIAMYPEGTRNGMKKKVKLKTGAAYIALKTNTPIIPVGISGTFKPFSKIVYNFGKPMDFSQYIDQQKDKEVLSKIIDEVMQEVIKLSKVEGE